MTVTHMFLINGHPNLHPSIQTADLVSPVVIVATISNLFTFLTAQYFQLSQCFISFEDEREVVSGVESWEFTLLVHGPVRPLPHQATSLKTHCSSKIASNHNHTEPIFSKKGSNLHIAQTIAIYLKKSPTTHSKLFLTDKCILGWA